MDAVIFRAEDDEDWEERPQSARRLAPDLDEEPDDDLAGSRYDDDEEWSDEESAEAGERLLAADDDDGEEEEEPPPARRRQGATNAASRLAGGPRMAVDDILDELLPEQLDWQRIVKTYPLTAVLVAAAGGFVLGRYKGLAVVTALSAFAADAVADNVNELLGDELL